MEPTSTRGKSGENIERASSTAHEAVDRGRRPRPHTPSASAKRPRNGSK